MNIREQVRLWLFPEPEVVGSPEWETILEVATPIVEAAFRKTAFYETDSEVTEWAVYASNEDKLVVFNQCVFEGDPT